MTSIREWLSGSTKIIAEAGVNHNGDVELAIDLVDAAAVAGADVIKFQSFRTEELVTREASSAPYQMRSTGETGQWNMLRSLELREEEFSRIAHHARLRGIEFLSSPFDVSSIRFLVEELNVPVLKIGSGEISNAPLLLAAARTGRGIILSTGMSTLDEVAAALDVLAYGYAQAGQPTGQGDFANAWSQYGADFSSMISLMHCTTEYPAPFHEVNLRAMQTLADQFGLAAGYSDHTQGIAVSCAAAAMGARIIEKHFTLDSNMEGPDHQASLMPDQFGEMVRSVRQIEMAMGTGQKEPTASEIPNMAVARRSLVAIRVIEAGEMFTESNLGARRPGKGTSPLQYWDFLGRRATRSYQPGDLIA